MSDCDREEHINIVELDDKGEHLNLVDVIWLGETSSNKTSLVTCNSTIRMIFECEDPLACDDGRIHRRGYYGPSTLRDQDTTSKSINAFYASTYVASTCDHIINMEVTKDDRRKKSEKWNIYYKHVYL